MSHPHPFELLFKFNYLRTNSKLSDYSVWLNKLCLKLGYGVGPKLPHVVQPPKAMEGKWRTIEAAGEWALKNWELLLLLAEQYIIGVRAGGLISSEHFQQAEWGRVLNWMRRPTMHCSIAWITELSNIALGWQNWSKSEGQFDVSFRTTELAKQVQQRVKQTQMVAWKGCVSDTAHATFHAATFWWCGEGLGKPVARSLQGEKARLASGTRSCKSTSWQTHPSGSICNRRWCGTANKN